jgi:CheY-like chemotaxis protein
MTHLILLVEDSSDDVFFMQYALKKAGISHPLRVVTDGQAAVDYLSGAGKYANRVDFPLPTIIFLDLKLPCFSGFDVLEWMRQQSALAQIPVFILTGSSEERDKTRAQQLGAKEYLVKPPEQLMLRRAFEIVDKDAALFAPAAQG